MGFNLDITGLYAGLLAILLVVLSFNVIRFRLKHRVGTGHGDVSELDKAIRIHGNFSEYMPIALVLLGVLELGGLADTWLHAFGATLVVGRLLHAAGLSKTKGTSLPRLVGVLSTFIVLVIMGVMTIIQFID
ncbi:MAG: MAPEG family protein [Thalassotalea sp.]|nr:MAPEG family protein [Thalassotalea sp.]